MSLAETLSARIADNAPLGESAITTAVHATVDTIAVACAAREDETVTRLEAALGPQTAGPATVLATGSHVDAVQAALHNGTAAHALDFDDVDDALIGHPSAVLVPAALAVAESVAASGTRYLEAYTAGLDIARALAAGLDIAAHFRKGWHSTATIGSLAAAAAAARLYGLDQTGIRHALGIAGSLAAGSRQNFGTMTKPLHAGFAASNGVLAAQLAAGGLTADPDQLDAPLGFLALYGDQAGQLADAHARATRALQPTKHHGLNVKLHPCCYATHAAADATLEATTSLSPAEVDRIDVALPEGGLRPLIVDIPSTGLEGKFSLGYVIAACVYDRGLSLSTFTDRAVARPQVRALLARVHGTESLSPTDTSNTNFRAHVTVHTTHGERHRATCEAPRGHATRRIPERDLRAKFVDCLAFADYPDPGAAYQRLTELPTTKTLDEQILPVVESTPRPEGLSI